MPTAPSAVTPHGVSPLRECWARVYRQNLQNSNRTEAVRTHTVSFRPKDWATAPQTPPRSTGTPRCCPAPVRAQGDALRIPGGENSSPRVLPLLRIPLPTCPCREKPPRLIFPSEIKTLPSARYKEIHIPGRRKRFAPAGSKMPRRGGGKASLSPPSFLRGCFSFPGALGLPGPSLFPLSVLGCLSRTPGRWDRCPPEQPPPAAPTGPGSPAPHLRPINNGENKQGRWLLIIRFH